MCWKHEQEYSEICFDFLWEDYGLYDEDSIVQIMKGFDVEFKSHEVECECRNEFFELLTKWHNDGSIKPRFSE